MGLINGFDKICPINRPIKYFDKWIRDLDYFQPKWIFELIYVDPLRLLYDFTYMTPFIGYFIIPCNEEGKRFQSGDLL